MLEARRQFVEFLQHHALVEDLDFTRDGYRTVVLELGDLQDAPSELDQCPVCVAVGLEERITEHDCQDFLDWQETPR